MATAQAKIYKTSSPAGWYYTFDRSDISDAGVDNFATAANPNAALDSLKTLVGALPGTLFQIEFTARTFEP